MRLDDDGDRSNLLDRRGLDSGRLDARDTFAASAP